MHAHDLIGHELTGHLPQTHTGNVIFHSASQQTEECPVSLTMLALTLDPTRMDKTGCSGETRPVLHVPNKLELESSSMSWKVLFITIIIIIIIIVIIMTTTIMSIVITILTVVVTMLIFITMFAACFRSTDSFYNGAFQTVRVNNNQTLTGQTAASPRAISSLPFVVTDSISKFADNYTQPCPNVVAPGRAGKLIHNPVLMTMQHLVDSFTAQ